MKLLEGTKLLDLQGRHIISLAKHVLDRLEICNILLSVSRSGAAHRAKKKGRSNCATEYAAKSQLLLGTILQLRTPKESAVVGVPSPQRH